jgi:hypothetical protein
MGTVGNQMYHISITNVPGEGYSINVSFAQNLISTFLFHHYDSVLVKVSRTQHNIYGALAHKKSLVSVLVKVSNTTYTVLWHIRRAWCLF